MNLRAIAILIACGFLLALMQLLGALVHPALAVGCGVAIGLGMLGLFRFFEIDFDPWWKPLLVSTVSSLLGILIALLNPKTASWTLGFAPAAAFATAGVIILSRRGAARRCALCNRRLGSDLAFDCPRCGLLVCDQRCWNFNHCRCRLCEQNRVPIFSPDGRWWDKQLGPRVGFGRCQLCATGAEGVDLRACAKCGRPQCRPCWDYANGQCSRCGWTLGDLPSTLKVYMLLKESSASGKGPARARSVR